LAKQIGETRVHTYEVGASRRITARVTIGEGQRGGWAAFLDNKLLDKGSKSKALGLGEADRLRGRRLIVNSVVIDVRPETNRLSVTTTVKGGKKPLRASHTNNGDDGATANYVTVVIFI
jgi:hypothetical protein